MASYLIFAVVQAILVQIAYSQCVNRIPNCAQALPVETYVPIEAIGPNQLIIGQGLPLLPLPNYAPYTQTIGYPELAYASTVIQDSTVANNLANTLQLLVVSNLLSSTLPGCDPYYLDPYMPLGPLGPYNYYY